MRLAAQTYRPSGALIAVALALALSGCIFFAPAHGYEVIKGTVEDERNAAYPDCRLEMLSVDDRRVFDYRRIDAEFRVTFAVPPLAGRFLLRIGCVGSDEAFTSEPMWLGGMASSYPAAIELGRIQLKRRRGSR
jgi:hypothetical protein